MLTVQYVDRVAFIASLSISLLTYAASSADTNALSNETLLVLNVIWFSPHVLLYSLQREQG
jgi:hypothetical protein